MAANKRTKTYKMFCPNCGVIIAGIVGEDGVAKNTCRHCGIKVVRTENSRRHVKVDVYWPKDGYLDDLIE